MKSRTMPILVMAIIFGIVLAACGAATEQPSAPAPVNEAAATQATSVEAAPTSTPAPPAEPTATPAPAVAAEEATEAPSEAADPSTAEPEAAAETPVSSEVVRAFQIVAEQSEASYQVQEEFFNQPVSIFNPIGRTNAIEGEFQLEMTGNQVRLLDNRFVVDLRTLTSNDGRRDRRIRGEWLESDTYPWAEFKATAIESFPESAVEGQDVPFKIIGDLTIREITRPATFDAVARLDGQTFTGAATTYVLMRDYGFEPPSVLGFLQVTDGVTVTVKFTAQETITTP